MSHLLAGVVLNACVHEAFGNAGAGQLEAGGGESGVQIAPAELSGEGSKLPGELQGRKTHGAFEILAIAPREGLQVGVANRITSWGQAFIFESRHSRG